MSSSISEFQDLKIPLEYIKKATNNFGVGNFIAKGGFGEVYRGEFLQSDVQTLVAVKRLTPSNSNNGDADFWREIMLLSDYKHENIILLLGYCYQSQERILVYEYAPNKSLDNHLDDPKFTWTQRLKICLGAARGLEYLHNPRGGQQRLLHRDIKSANILLDENWNPKIADFGFSKYGPANQQHSMLISEPKGTLGYCDPVFLDTTFYKKESDVYSFGVVLLEVLCSRLCVDYKYNDMRRSLPVFVKNSSKEQIRDALIDVNLLQQMDEDSFDIFLTLVYQCLESEQNQRPPMELIVKKLEAALEYQKLGEKPDDADDNMIKRWSSGKEGNLPALLSTLQHLQIFGPESGWEPVSLTETIETLSVRRPYDKAVSLIKRKARGGSSREKYICRKVHEILKEGLLRFNSEPGRKVVRLVIQH